MKQSPPRATKRAVDGILLLDKPAGITSNGILQRVRHLYRARKAGHTGTLDPFATGMLPVCLGEATKFSGYLLDQAKTYLAQVRLGVATSTGDCTGDAVREAPVPELGAADIDRVLDRFRGDIEQVPPMYSALKIDGQRLHQLARQGKVVERKPRPVTIHRLELVAAADAELTLRVTCSKGTYIRTLAEDIAQALGTVGHTAALRREAVEPFGDALGMHTLAELEGLEPDQLDPLLLPPDTALLDLPRVDLAADMAWRLTHGQNVALDVAPDGATVRVYGSDGFLGVGDVTGDRQLRPRRLISNQ